jgi:hypothetical protein
MRSAFGVVSIAHRAEWDFEVGSSLLLNLISKWMNLESIQSGRKNGSAMKYNGRFDYNKPKIVGSG